LAGIKFALIIETPAWKSMDKSRLFIQKNEAEYLKDAGSRQSRNREPAFGDRQENELPI
jgi:hypothetical protein